MCEKVPHESRQAARQVAKGVSQKYRQSMGVYWCDDCEAWHIATKGKAKRKPKREKYPFRYMPPPKKKLKIKRR